MARIRLAWGAGGKKEGMEHALRRGLGCKAGGANAYSLQKPPDKALRAVQGVADGQAPTPLREGDRKDLTSSQGGPPQERGGTIPWHAALQLRSTPSDNATASGAGAGAGNGAGERGGAAVMELNLATEPSLPRGRQVDGAAGDRGGGGGGGGLGHAGLNLGGPLHQVQRSRTHAQLDLSGPTGAGGLAPDRPPRSGGAAMSSGPGFSLNLGGPHAPAQQRQHQRDSAAQLSNLGRSRDSLGAGGSGAGANGGDELNPHAPSRMASDTAHTLADFDQDIRPIGRKRLGSAAGERHTLPNRIGVAVKAEHKHWQREARTHIVLGACTGLLIGGDSTFICLVLAPLNAVAPHSPAPLTLYICSPSRGCSLAPL